MTLGDSSALRCESALASVDHLASPGVHCGIGVRQSVTARPTGRRTVCLIANVLGALPKSAHPGAKKALAQIWNAEDKNHARAAAAAFHAAYGAKFPKATAKITDDLEELLAVYDYPAEHWVQLRTSNHRVHFRYRQAPEQDHPRSGLASGGAGDGVQAHRGRPGSLARGQRTHLVALVRAGATFEAGKLVERPDEHPRPEAA